jgi:uncharacterized protein (DUF2147 family)
MFRLGLLAGLLCLGLAAPAAATGQWTASPTGLWATANHNAVVEITPCGPDLCGRIVGLARSPAAPAPTDWRGGSQCGLTIIRTAPATDGSGDQVWRGSILDPRDGAVYHAQIRLDPAHHLLLRGYVGLPIFGETQTWTAYNGPTGPNCRIPS